MEILEQQGRRNGSHEGGRDDALIWKGRQRDASARQTLSVVGSRKDGPDKLAKQPYKPQPKEGRRALKPVWSLSEPTAWAGCYQAAYRPIRPSGIVAGGHNFGRSPPSSTHRLHENRVPL